MPEVSPIPYNNPVKWVQWSSPSYRSWNLTSEWSVTSPRRCSVSSGGETLPRPPPHPRLPLPPPPFSPPAVRPGPLPLGDTDNVPDILEGGGDWHSESGGQECCPTPKTTGPSSQQITLWPVSTARVWGACSGTPCRKRPRPGRSTHLSGSQMVLSATMAFNTSAFAKGNKCAELGQQEKEGNHRIVTSEKLLEWHLTELIQVTDEALGPRRREGLSQRSRRTGHHLPMASPGGNLG